MAKVTDYAAVTTLLEAMWFYTPIDTDLDGNFESRKVSMASIRSHLLESQIADSATAIAFNYNTANTMSTTGWKMAQWKNNGSILCFINEFGQFSKTIGVQELYVSHKMMTAPTTGGAGALVSLETTAGRPDIRGFPFDGTTNENVEFEIALPKKWALGTVTARFYWSTVGLDTDSVIWGIQMVAVSDGSTIDVAYGSAIEVTDNIQGVTEELQISAATAAITAAGTPADADMLYIRIYRDAATDTAAEDAVLAGVKLFLTMDAATDD